MTRSWATLPGLEPPPTGGEVSPALRFLKWHRYDAEGSDGGRPERVAVKLPPDNTKSKRPFLREVASDIERVVTGERYRAWYEEDYPAALDSIPSLAAGRFDAATIWRLLVGYATNPALESGLTLHHLYGFPYLPGSSVKGLVHHTAEMGLMEEELGGSSGFTEDNEAPPVPEEPALERFLERAEIVWTLFGSLALHRAEDSDTGRPTGAWTPRAVLEAWGRVLGESRGEEDRVVLRMRALREEHTGAALGFYDAVPVPPKSSGQIVQVDILTPHYGEYYRGTRTTPSDDQTPVPVPFLAVAPGVRFTFPIRVRGLPDEEAGGESSTRRPEVLTDAERALSLAQEWLRRGLSTRGIGAKTAAGYGYFGSRRAPDFESGIPTFEDVWTLPTRERLRELELPAEEREARQLVPDDVDAAGVAEVIDQLAEATDTELTRAVARRILELHPELIEGWKDRQKKSIQKRVRWIEEQLGEEES